MSHNLSGWLPDWLVMREKGKVTDHHKGCQSSHRMTNHHRDRQSSHRTTVETVSVPIEWLIIIVTDNVPINSLVFFESLYAPKRD